MHTSYCIADNFRGLYISQIAMKFIFAETSFVDCIIKATPTQVLLAAVGCEVYDSCVCGHRVYKDLWTKEKDFFVEQRLLLSKSLRTSFHVWH